MTDEPKTPGFRELGLSAPLLEALTGVSEELICRNALLVAHGA